MTKDFHDQIDKFVHSLNENLPEIYYQAFDFSNVNDSRTLLMNLNYEKTKVSFLNLEMIADMFQVYSAVHSAVQESSSRDFSVDVPYRLANTRSIGDALRTFGGFGKPYILVISIHDRTQTEDLFEKISQINNAKKMSQEQMEECMKKNFENIRQYYFGTTNDQDQAISHNPIGEIVTKMVAAKNL